MPSVAAMMQQTVPTMLNMDPDQMQSEYDTAAAAIEGILANQAAQSDLEHGVHFNDGSRMISLAAANQFVLPVSARYGGLSVRYEG